MRHILNKKQRDNHELNNLTVTIKWSVSRGQDTYGYNICSLWTYEGKQETTLGGGYDMMGVVVGSFIRANFPEEIKKLDNANFYGLTFSKKYKNGKYRRLKKYSPGCNYYLDGACGIRCMQDILEKIGFKLKYITETTNSKIFRIEAV